MPSEREEEERRRCATLPASNCVWQTSPRAPEAVMGTRWHSPKALKTACNKPGSTRCGRSTISRPTRWSFCPDSMVRPSPEKIPSVSRWQRYKSSPRPTNSLLGSCSPIYHEQSGAGIVLRSPKRGGVQAPDCARAQ